MYDFPELVFVMRHGTEPWVDLAVKLMLKWPVRAEYSSGPVTCGFVQGAAMPVRAENSSGPVTCGFARATVTA